MSDILEIPPHHIIEDEPETGSACAPIQVSGPDDPTPEQALRIIEVSGALDFWNAREEDCYTLEDGEPV